ncbi:MAG: carbohydrate ABC transporter permease [Bacteroidaceae bacterium]
MKNKQNLKARHDGFKRMDTSEIVFKIISYFIVTIFALFCLYPLIYAISASLSGIQAVNGGKVVFLPIDIQIDAFKDVILEKYFWISYSNTMFITFYGTIYCMLLSILGAYALSKANLFGHKFLNFILIFTMWFSAGMIPIYLNYIQTRTILGNMGIADQKWLVVLAMGMSAFNVILLRNSFESVPKEIEEAAKVDGANEFQIMSKVFVPMSKATIATVALFYGVSRWNGYFWAMKTVENIYDKPLQVVIQSEIATIQEQVSEYGAQTVGAYASQSFAYAMIVCAIIPILLIYPFIQKYFAVGVNIGGVKE